MLTRCNRGKPESKKSGHNLAAESAVRNGQGNYEYAHSGGVENKCTCCLIRGSTSFLGSRILSGVSVILINETKIDCYQSNGKFIGSRPVWPWYG